MTQQIPEKLQPLIGRQPSNFSCSELKHDASRRRYVRLHGLRIKKLRLSGLRRSFIGVTTPDIHRDLIMFRRIGLRLRKWGFSVPAIYSTDLENGAALMEDFGDLTFARALELPVTGRQAVLYQLALQVLIKLQLQSIHPREQFWLTRNLPFYHHQSLADEATRFIDGYWPHVMGQPADPGLRTEWHAIWNDLYANMESLQPVMVLRDYHVENLMLLCDRSDIAACGLLDFQDACRGHPAYDLVSLYEDARIDVAAYHVTDGLQTYRRAMGYTSASWQAFMDGWNLLGGGRHAKVLGQFASFGAEYAQHLPRIERLFKARLYTPGLERVREWLMQFPPMRMRLGLDR